MMVAIVGFIALRYVASCRAIDGYVKIFIFVYSFLCAWLTKMAEQLLTEGQINEEELRLMSTDRARCDIGMTLLTHSGIQISWYSYRIGPVIKVMPSWMYPWLLDNYSSDITDLCIEDMKDRCIMCGGSDTSLVHPDYFEWVSKYRIAAFYREEFIIAWGSTSRY